MSDDTAMSVLLKLLGVAALVILNGFFVAAELALVKIRDTQLETLVLKGMSDNNNQIVLLFRPLIQFPK